MNEVTTDEAERVALAALPLLEAKDDHSGLAEVWASLARGAYNGSCRFGQMERAAEESLRESELAGQKPQDLWTLGWGLVWGPRPATEALTRFETLLPEWDDPLRALDRGYLLAMNDRIEEARTLVRAAEERLSELGQRRYADVIIGDIEQLAGNYEVTAERYGSYLDYAVELGIKGSIASCASGRGHALCALGRFDEAEPLAIQGREAAAEDDVEAQRAWRQVAARVHAHCGDHGAAEQLAHEAVAITQRTDSPYLQADAYSDLAEVLEAAGRRDDAVAAWREALDRYEGKEIVPLIRRTRERLAELQPA
jgi:tetratricopeptide (TPR) repeat protein